MLSENFTSAIIGAASGWLFSELSSYFRNRRDRAKQRENARLLVGLEIEQNLDAVRRTHSSLLPVFDKENRVIGFTIASMPRPPWSHEAWSGLLHLLPEAMTAAEIQACHDFHEEIRRLDAVHETLSAMYSESVTMPSANDSPLRSEFGWLKTSRFYQESPALVTSYRVILGRLDSLPSPLGKGGITAWRDSAAMMRVKGQ